MLKLASSPWQVKSTILYIVLVVLCLHISASHVFATAGINKQINFQGKVVNTNGTNVSNGSYDFVFKIYSVSSGGSPIWTETWNSGTSQVTVTDGVFRVALGTYQSLPGSIDFNTDNIYLGVEFNGDGEMTPRVRFTAVPYAFNASKVSGLTVTDTTGTFTLANGKTLTVNNTLSFSGTDSTAFTLPSSNDTLTGIAATQTLTNKTLTAPKFADLGFIADPNGNELLIFDSVASAVNEITLANAATGNGVSLAATGGDSNVAFSITSKAAGALTLDSGTTGTVNVGTGNNAKTINLGTGTAGNTINIGTNNTVADSINIGSALDSVAITGSGWSVTSGGALTVSSCTGCGAGGGANTALSNLASVAINTSLLPGSDDTIDLGDNTHRFRDAYLGGETLHIGTSTTDEGSISYNTTSNIFDFGTDSTTNGDIAFFTDDLYLDKSAGYLGVGTTTPVSIMHFYSTANAANSVTIDAKGTASAQQATLDFLTLGNGAITVGNASSKGWSMFARGNAYTTSNQQNDFGLSYWNGSTWIDPLRIDSATGNVGLGTTVPGNQLTINSAATPSSSQVRITANDLGSLSFLNYAAGNTQIGFDVDYSSSAWVARNAATAWILKNNGLLQIAGSTGNSVNGTATQTVWETVDLSNGYFGIGDQSPAGLLTVGNGDLFQVSSSGGVTFNGVATDITTGTNEALTLAPNGTGAVQVNSGVTTGTGTSSALSIVANSLTTGNALNISSNSVTSGRLFNIAPNFAGVGVTGYGVYVDAVDSTANANTDYSLITNVSLSGNAAKTAYGVSSTVTSSSTTADSLYAGAFNPGASGAISTGSRTVASLYLYPNSSAASNGGTTTLYGIYANPTVTNATTGSTTNAYGAYIVPTTSLTTGGTLTSYGIRIRNNTSIDTTGTTTQYGLYIDAMSGADANYAFYLAGTSGTAADGITFGGDTNLYRGGADVLQTDDQIRTVGSVTSSIGYSSFVSGDSFARFYIQTDGQLYWGDGSGAQDTTLYRSAANTLRTDDAFNVNGTFNVTTAGVVTGVTGYTQSSGTHNVTAADGSLFDFSSVNTSSTSEGIKLPQATSCASGIANGQICWDNDTFVLYVGNGTTAQSIGGGGISGSGASGQLTYWNGTSSVAGSTKYLFDPAATTGTGSSSELYLDANSITSGNGLYISATGLIANGSAQYINAQSTITSGTVIAGTDIMIAANSSSAATTFIGRRGETYIGNSGAITGVAVGLEGLTENAATQTINAARGVQGYSKQSAAGTITFGQGVYGQILNSAGTFTSAAALYAANPSAAGTITTNYGLYVEAQTKGSTNVGVYVADAGTYSLQLASTDGDVASGITFGTDTNLYRSAADTLSLGAGDSLSLLSGAGTFSQTYTGTTTVASTITAASITTGAALSIDGPTSTGVTSGSTSGFVKLTSDVGSAGTTGTLLYLAPDFSAGSTTTAYGLNIRGTDSTTVGNVDILDNGTLILTGAAAKNGYGLYRSVTSSSTVGDTTYSGYFTSNVTGAISTGSRTQYGLFSWPINSANNTGGFTSLYGIASTPQYSSSSDTTGSTVELYGNYVSTSGQLTTGGNITQYGVYIATGSSSTAGNSTKYGLYVQDQTGADTNYSLYLESTSGAASGGITFGGDTNLYRSAADTLLTDDNLSVALDLTVTGNDITFGNGESISNSVSDTIVFASNATSGAGVIRLPVKTDTGDPSLNVEGNMYYNTFDNKFRCYQGSAWTDCIGAGGTTTLQQAYDAGTPTILTDASGDIIFQVIGGATDTQFKVQAVSAPEVDLMSITNSGQGTTTDGVDGLSIDFVQADDVAGNDTNSGLNVNVTGASNDLGDVLNAINVAVTSPQANNRERGISIGSGFDEDVYFASAAATIRMQDGGEILFTDGSVGGTTTRDIPLARIKEYFAGANYGVVEAQGFINIDGSFYMENFNRAAPAVSANQTGSSRVIGDTGAWALQERGTGGTATNATFGCSATPGSTDTSNAVNGVLGIALETSTNTNGTNLTPPWCNIPMSSATGAGSVVPVLKAANKFIMYYKVKMSSAYTNSVTGNMIWFGADNQTNGGWIGKPTFTGTSTGGIWITNVDGTQTQTGTNATAGTQWVGWSRYNGSDSTVACSGFNPSSNTSNYALFRIEVRDTNNAQFFIDGDTSNGVAMTSCGQVTNNIPTAPIRPAMILGRPYMNSTGTVWTAYVDLFAYVQDDPRGVVAPNGLSQVDAPEPTFNPITGADVAEQYRFSESDDVSAGDIVSLGDVVGDGDKAARPYDRKMYGVVSESPGMVLGDSAVNSLPVAISGRVPVKVTAKNGAIKIGDPITSSDIPGVGMRATQSGKILGTAMENYSKDEVGKILVSINPGYYINDGHDVAMVENDPEMVLGASASATISDNALGLSIQASSSARPTVSVTESSSVGQIADKMFMFKNGLRVDKVFESLSDAIFYGKTRFQGAVEFVSSTIFRSDVEFEGSVTFNSNTAGYAKIKRGQRFVNVTFDQEYKNQPVVQVSPNIFKLTDATFQDVVAQGFCTELEGIEACQDKLVDTILNSGVNYAVQNQTTQGFLIVLDQNAPVDLTFSWQAIAVHDPKTATNSGPSDLVMPYYGNFQISNRFGEKSNDPAIQAKDEKNGLKGHDGYDISMPEGTPIVAVDDGVVEIQNDDYGTTLVLKHSWGKTVYGHLSKTSVTVGQTVSAGQQIALSGNTGLSTGPHLHFGMKVDSASVAGGYNGFVNPSLYFAFDSHKSGPAVAGISVHLDSSISASSSSLLHHEDERAASSSSATEPGKDAADLLSGEEVSKRAETN